MRQHHRLIFRSLFRARVYDVKTDELIGVDKTQLQVT